jgi:hypothetical protein
MYDNVNLNQHHNHRFVYDCYLDRELKMIEVRVGSNEYLLRYSSADSAIQVRIALFSPQGEKALDNAEHEPQGHRYGISYSSKCVIHLLLRLELRYVVIRT